MRNVFNPDTSSLPYKARVYDVTDALGNFLKEGRVVRSLKDVGSTKKIARPGDVIVSRLRSYLREITIVPKLDHVALISTEFIVLRRKEKGKAHFLLPYLLSNPVQTILQWGQDGSNHPRFAEGVLLDLPLPNCVWDAQEELNQIVENAIVLFESASSLYAQAESLLLAELGLDGLDLSHQPTYTRNFSEVWAAGRVDAEHFQPKYYALLDKIQGTGQAVRLGDWLKEPIRRGVQPKYDEDGTMIVINSQHIGKTYIELEDNRRTTREFAAQNPHAVVRPYDVLLNSTGYITIGRCQTLIDNVSAIVDSHISIIRPKSGLDPVYLAMFLNSPAGQMQTERSWTGSSGQIELRSELIENYVVWKPDETLQRQIRGLVEDAHKVRLEAKRLLEEAKQRVEALILGKDA